MRLPLESRKQAHRKAASWLDCEPFVENRQGILIHRPRSVTLYNLHSQPHIAVNYWCGGGSTDSNSKAKLTFLSEPPVDVIVCHACEARAQMAGLPSASFLAGRHVHTGKLKPIKTCGCGLEPAAPEVSND